MEAGPRESNGTAEGVPRPSRSGLAGAERTGNKAGREAAGPEPGAPGHEPPTPAHSTAEAPPGAAGLGAPTDQEPQETVPPQGTGPADFAAQPTGPAPLPGAYPGPGGGPGRGEPGEAGEALDAADQAESYAELRPPRRLRPSLFAPIVLLSLLGSLMFAFPLAFAFDEAGAVVAMLGLLIGCSAAGWGMMAARRVGYTWPGLPPRGSGRRPDWRLLLLYGLGLVILGALAVWRVAELR
ncbi:hypothetical protein [Streptomyces hoynatensis]|uniref:hypothetical protein n=1 Tax=Streptomyces hoynatensis TaxID=1141874 RepID=UPI0026D8D0DC